MEQKIVFRTVIEVLGKPKEHVESSIRSYIKKIKTNPAFSVLKEDFANIKKQEDMELWATFSELEIETSSMKDLTRFCFDYMPSMLEIVEPKTLSINDEELSEFLNDLQAKLHNVDMVAKQLQTENKILNSSLGNLLKNYITVLLSKGDLSAKQLSKLTGINQDKLEDFLDQLIDEGKIDLNNEIYTLKKQGVV